MPLVARISQLLDKISLSNCVLTKYDIFSLKYTRNHLVAGPTRGADPLAVVCWDSVYTVKNSWRHDSVSSRHVRDQGCADLWWGHVMVLMVAGLQLGCGRQTLTSYERVKTCWLH